MNVTLDPKLYRVAAVRQTAEEFAHLAEIKVTAEKGKIEVAFDRIDPEMGPGLVDEFLNFALAATVSSRG
jgi:hypothetical protein